MTIKKDDSIKDNNRKAYQHLPGEENPQFGEDGLWIYNEMRKKYPNNDVIDLDNILNGICASLSILMHVNVDRSNHLAFLQLIYQVLKKNL